MTRQNREYGQNKGKTINSRWRERFMDALARTSNIRQSALEAGKDTATVYRERRNKPEFARQWGKALLEGYLHLELETLDRLRNGVETTDRKFDIANALRLLSQHKESAAKELAREEMEDEEEILASIERKIDAMRAREKETAQMLAEDGLIPLVQLGPPDTAPVDGES